MAVSKTAMRGVTKRGGHMGRRIKFFKPDLASANTPRYTEQSNIVKLILGANKIIRTQFYKIFTPRIAANWRCSLRTFKLGRLPLVQTTFLI